MAITLYDATVAQFLQVVGAMRGVLAKGLEHAQAGRLDADALVDGRLAEDMFPLFLQVNLVAHHSAGALRNVRDGAFTLPPRDRVDYPGLQELLADAETELRGWTREAVDALAGREVALDLGAGARTVYSGEAFLTSFSTPNFYFHAVTAYDILRAKGVEIGKRDYLTGLRTKL